MIGRVNQEQKAYFADCLKIVGSTQLAVLGIKHVYDQGSVGLPLFIVSALIWVYLIVVGLKMFEDDGER